MISMGKGVIWDMGNDKLEKVESRNLHEKKLNRCCIVLENSVEAGIDLNQYQFHTILNFQSLKYKNSITSTLMQIIT